MNLTLDKSIHWLTHTSIGKLVHKLLNFVAFVIGVLFTLFIIYNVEVRLFLVITFWELEYIQKDGNKYTIGGELHKARPCELASTSVMAVPKMPFAPRVLIYQIKPSELLGGNAPTGNSTWGPWTIDIPDALIKYKDDIAFLEVVGTHKCHALWQQETTYGRVQMSRLP